MKIENDKYYTPKDLAKKLITKTFEIIGKDNITEIIEPSAGNGSFSNQIENCIAYDIEPENENIIKVDFLTLELDYKKGRLFIGNPPFGVHNKLVHSFYDKCCECGDYIAFILPLSCLNSDIKLYKFDLIFSQDLGEQYFTDRYLNCCFCIYKRPKNGKFNKKPNYKLNEIKIIEYRRIKNKDKQLKYIEKIGNDYCYSICNWGHALGKQPNFIGEYAQEAYFYCSDEHIKKEMLKLLEMDKIREYVKSTSALKISVMGLYKYFYENIDGLTLKQKN